MDSENDYVLPKWEDFSAFVDFGELEHLCHLMEQSAAEIGEDTEENYDIIRWFYKNSTLIKRISIQHVESEKIIENECPGLYKRTWIAQEIDALLKFIDTIFDNPDIFPEKLSTLLLYLHKILIAAHEIYNPRHRAAMIEKIKISTISKASKAASDKAINARYDAPGGSREKKKKAIEMYSSGKYGKIKDEAAYQIAKILCLSHGTVVRYLNNIAVPHIG